MSTTTDVAHLRDFRPDQDNARLHDERNLAAIETSMQTTGFGRPILAAKDGTVLAGNATLEAAGNIGMEEVILVHSDGTKPIIHVRTDLDPNSEMARLAAFYDNRTAELASWDTEVLAALMQEVDIAAVAMTPEEAADLIASDGAGQGTEGLTDPDEVPEPPVEPTTRPGDLWRLGEHRLLCGDSTVPTDLDRLMAGQRATMMWTDPPYGVSYVGKTKQALTIQNDGADGLAALLYDAFTNATGALIEGAPFYIARPPGALSVTFGNAVLGVGWRLHEELQWIKDSMVLGHSDYHLKHETIIFGYLPGGAGRRGRGGSGWYGDNSQVSVFEVDRPKASPDHPTGKPVALISPMLKNSSQPGDIVLDLFGGSGSTLIAAEQDGRRARLMELDPRYCDVIIRRWEAFTGNTAELERAP